MIVTCLVLVLFGFPVVITGNLFFCGVFSTNLLTIKKFVVYLQPEKIGLLTVFFMRKTCRSAFARINYTLFLCTPSCIEYSARHFSCR